MATDDDRKSARDRLNADVAQVATGDRAALRRVYDATSARLFGICLRFAADREGAEDALQETYVKLWRRADRFDPTRASAITWLSLIARGTAIDGARASGRRAAGTAAATEGMETMTGTGSWIDSASLGDCLDQLAEDTRTNILSAFYDGYSYDELARRAEVPLGTMKSRIRRALMALRRCLDDA